MIDRQEVLSLREKTGAPRWAVCPFCQKPTESMRFRKYMDWSYGCFNPACKIRPKTVCMSTEEEAKEEWKSAFVNRP